MARVLKNGLMVPSILATGAKIKRMAMEHCIMQMVMSMKESGKMIRPTEKACIIMQMEQTTMESGKTISNTASVLRDGLMVLSTRAFTMRVKRTVAENLPLLMDQFMRAIFR